MLESKILRAFASLLIVSAAFPWAAALADGPWPYDPTKPHGIDMAKLNAIGPEFDMPGLPPSPPPSVLFGVLDEGAWDAQTMALIMYENTIYWVGGLGAVIAPTEADVAALFPNGFENPMDPGNWLVTKLAYPTEALSMTLDGLGGVYDRRLD